jgi:hypothetical protein
MEMEKPGTIAKTVAGTDVITSLSTEVTVEQVPPLQPVSTF